MVYPGNEMGREIVSGFFENEEDEVMSCAAVASGRGVSRKEVKDNFAYFPWIFSAILLVLVLILLLKV